MVRSAILAALAAVLSAAPACASSSPPDPAEPADPAPAARAGNAFGLELYRHLAQRQGNLFFSPASVHQALTMTWHGARGPTAEQMSRVLRLDGEPRRALASCGALIAALQPPPDTYTLNVANRLWGDKGLAFQPGFLDPLRAHFGAALQQLDFHGDPDQARRDINAWVADRTEQRILDLLAPGAITRDTGLVLTNAVYFLSAWSEPFREHLTRQEPFHLQGGGSAPAWLMERTGSLQYGESAELQTVTLPYAGSQLEMVVLLPRDPLGLPRLEETLTPAALDSLLQARSRQQVRCRIPRFRLEDAFQLPKVLTAMGMPLAFDPAGADFSGMTGARDLFVSDVVHKAFVRVDEQGTEAAAATAVIMEKTSIGRPTREPVLFQADHPFLFLIRHAQSGAILFMGRLQDPAG